MTALVRLLSVVFASFLAFAFAASSIRRRVLRQNFDIIGLKTPLFYRFRLGFHLAHDLLTLIFGFVLPGNPPVPTLHPRSRAHMQTLQGGPSLPPTLLLTAHFGNWEAQAAAWGRLGVNLLGAARPLKSRAAHSLLTRLRARHGIHVVTTAVPRNALRHLNSPTKTTSPSSPNIRSPGGCFGILWDQHAPDSTRSGRFFGEPVSLNPLPFFLLAHVPCPVFFGVLLPGGTLRLIPLLARSASDEKGWEDRLARRYHRVLETLIRRHPAQWHGALHARFKMTRTYAGHRVRAMSP